MFGVRQGVWVVEGGGIGGGCGEGSFCSGGGEGGEREEGRG